MTTTNTTTTRQIEWLAAHGIEVRTADLGRAFRRIAPPAGYESLYVFAHRNTGEVRLCGYRDAAHFHGDHVDRFTSTRHSTLRSALAALVSARAIITSAVAS